jgi:hypothetical protein
MKRVRDFFAYFARLYRNLYLKKPPICLIWRRQTFLIKKKPKWGLAGWSLDQDSIKNTLGGGRQITDRRGLRGCLQKLAGALQKVCPPRRRLRRKIFRNKYPHSSNHSQIVDGFAFICIHTSYIPGTRTADTFIGKQTINPLDQ